MFKSRVLEIREELGKIDAALFQLIGLCGSTLPKLIIKAPVLSQSPPPAHSLSDARSVTEVIVASLSKLTPANVYRSIHRMVDYFNSFDEDIFKYGAIYWSEFSDAIDGWFRGHELENVFKLAEKGAALDQFHTIIMAMSESLGPGEEPTDRESALLSFTIYEVATLDSLANWIDVIRAIVVHVGSAATKISDDTSAEIRFVEIDSGSPDVKLRVRILARAADRIAKVIENVFEDYVLGWVRSDAKLRASLRLRERMKEAGFDVSKYDEQFENAFAATLQKLPGAAPETTYVVINGKKIKMKEPAQISYDGKEGAEPDQVDE